MEKLLIPAKKLLPIFYISRLSIEHNFKKHTAFTLAEVLITLTVIGVVAALAIPGIIARTQDAELRAAFKHNYSMLDQATRRLVQDNGGSLSGLFSNSDPMRNAFLPYLSYIRTCNDSTTTISSDKIISNCWSEYNYYLNKAKGTDVYYTDSQVILNNGAFVDFWNVSQSCLNTSLSTNDVCAEIGIDVNGLKGPNQYGRDIFSIWLTKNRLVPAGVPIDTYFNSTCDPNDSGDNGRGFGCAAKVLQNQDY